MSRTCWVVLFAILFAASMCSAAQWAGRPYVGGGLLYGIERFTGEYSGIDDESGSYNFDFDNSLGLFLKGGYFFTENLAVEGLARYHHEWKASESDNVDLGFGFGGADIDASVKIKAYDFTVNGKLCMPMAQFMPYIVAGAGIAHFKGEAEVSADVAGFGGSDSESASDTGPLVRIGGGCDFFLSDNVGIEGEVSYNHGFGDVVDARFIDLTFGVIFAF